MANRNRHFLVTRSHTKWVQKLPYFLEFQITSRVQSLHQRKTNIYTENMNVYKIHFRRNRHFGSSSVQSMPIYRSTRPTFINIETCELSRALKLITTKAVRAKVDATNLLHGCTSFIGVGCEIGTLTAHSFDP